MRRTIPVFILGSCILFLAVCGESSKEEPRFSAGSKSQPAPSTERVGPRGILYRGVRITIPEPAQLSESEAKKKAVAESLDKQNLLTTSRIVEDRSESMLEPPPRIAPFVGKEIKIAKEPPLVEFGIVPVRPLFFAAPPEGNRVGPWSNWSQANYYAKTGKFYSAVGDHGAYDAHVYIVEYDSANKEVRCLPEINAVLGRTKDQFGEGKIHGWLDFYPKGSPNLWFCTYWAKYPEPEEQDYATGYDGGHIMSVNVETGDIIDYGVPLKRASWPYHRVDTKRGIIYAVGMFGEFVAWDMNEQKTLWAGYPPKDMGWYHRAILIDEETGLVYSTNWGQPDPEVHFVKYDPAKNRLFKLDCHMPADPQLKPGEPPRRSGMRAQTAHRGPDGLFWGVSVAGELFTFDPVKEEIADKGLNWPGEMRYTTSMARSPRGRYVYYLPGAHGLSFADGTPIIQYDTQTDTKKVLAFLHPYFFQKYGYTIGGTFSIVLDDAGARLFILMNGAFVDPEEQLKMESPDVFGHPSVLLIHIPESERVE
jgi:hypothetical protein